ncbi:zinc finger, CCHC-type containing protein [Tanacetum coccineum]
MTTSVGNNSVFRSFFEKQKLTGPNFIDWYRQLRLVLSTEDKEYYLEHPIPVAPVAPPGQQIPPEDLAAHAAWVKGQKEVAVLMLLTMDLDIQRNLAHLGAYDMLQELKAMFSKQAEQELLQTVREFHTCKQEEGQSVSSHVLKMKGYIDNLERLGQPVGQNLAVSLILVSLNKDFTSFVQNFNMQRNGKTIMNHVSLSCLKNLCKENANPSTSCNTSKMGSEKQKNKPHKAGRGVKERNCPASPELMKKKKLPSGSSASVYTTQGLRGSRKLKPGALSLYVGDGHRAAVEAIGTYHLELPSGLVLLLEQLFIMTPLSLEVFQREVENQLGKTIKSLRSDRGGEYMSQEFLDHLKEHGIIAHRTPPYTPQNNGVSERRNRTLLDMVRSMMSQTTLPKSFWDYALETAAPFQHGSIQRSVGLHQNLEFFESKLLDLKASGSVEDLEEIQEEDTNPSVDTSLNHEEDDQEIDEPQSDINPIRRSTRTRRPTYRLCLYIDTEEHELGDLGELANYRATLADPLIQKWLDAMLWKCNP